MIAAVDPTVGDPTLAGMGWTIPATGSPDVAGAVPAVVAVYPNVTTIGGRTAALYDGWRRPDANHNLRKRSRGKHGESKQQCQCNFFHDRSIPPWQSPEPVKRSDLTVLSTPHWKNSCKNSRDALSQLEGGPALAARPAFMMNP
jgi:hypothetical protein